MVYLWEKKDITYHLRVFQNLRGTVNKRSDEIGRICSGNACHYWIKERLFLFHLLSTTPEIGYYQLLK
jgi:hypothetical protein